MVNLIIWLINFLMSFSYLWNTHVHSLVTGVIAIICLIISTFYYIRIYRIIRRHQLQILAQQPALQSADAENNLNTRGLQISALNTFVFYMALIICYLPSHVLLTLHGLSHTHDWPTEWEFANTAVLMNSSINPILYCWRLRELRTAVIKTVRQMSCKQTEEN